MNEPEQNLYGIELLSLELPEAEDWEQREAEAALWQYASALDLAQILGKQRGEDFAEEMEKVNDLLFLRDEIEEAMLLKGSSLIEEISSTTPTLQELDDRLRRQARTHKPFTEFLLREYEIFRDQIAPEHHAWWWWLDE